MANKTSDKFHQKNAMTKIGKFVNKFWTPNFLTPQKKDSRIKQLTKSAGLIAYRVAAITAGLTYATIPTLVIGGSFLLYDHIKTSSTSALACYSALQKDLFDTKTGDTKTKGSQANVNTNGTEANVPTQRLSTEQRNGLRGIATTKEPNSTTQKTIKLASRFNELPRQPIRTR